MVFQDLDDLVDVLFGTVVFHLHVGDGVDALLEECIGPAFRKEPEALAEFKRFENDASVLDRLEKIKLENKERFAKYLEEKSGAKIDTSTIFDVHVKRIHE